MTSADHLIRAAAGAAVSVGSWLATGIEQIPEWIREFGLPLPLLGGAVWAIVFLYREVKAERAARIADRDAFIVRIEKSEDKGEVSREALLRATLEQTHEFKALRRELTRGKE